MMRDVCNLLRLAGFLSVTLACGSLAAARTAPEILKSEGVRGGVVVVVGEPDAELLAGIAGGGEFIVHGLVGDGDEVAACRAELEGRGIYGPVSVDHWGGGKLPYIDNIVNLLVVRGGEVDRAEIMRVLAPRGVALVDGKKTVKPVPAAIDEWTHYLYDPANNAVSHDKVTGPPRRMQWVAAPRYSRHHDKMSSVSAVVSTGGRVFSIVDEGPLWSILTDPSWSLTARDAFNGKLLWKREIASWHNHLFGLKSGPGVLPRRLVAMDGAVYSTLGLDAPVEKLDAVCG